MTAPTGHVHPTLATLGGGATLTLKAVHVCARPVVPDRVSDFLSSLTRPAAVGTSGFAVQPSIMFVRVENWYGESFSASWRTRHA